METTAEIRTVYGSVYGEPGRMNPPLFKVYRRRWFVLLVLCLLNCSNATIWLTFAPVAAQSAQFLQVSLEDINWLSVVFMVVAIPLSFGTTWLLDTFGLRITLVLGAWLNMFGALLRFLGTATLHGSDLVFPVVMLGQILGALAQPLIIFTPTKLAALWFPDHQRATANMFASMSNPVGILIANLVSPAIAKTPMQAYAVPTFIICFFASLGVLSSRPPTPPSAGAESSGSEPFVQGIKLLLRNKAYLVLLLCFGSGIAVFTCFTSLLEQILCVQGYSNKFAGVCGALFIGAGVLGAVPVGLYVDKTKKFMEVSKINMSLAAVACAGFSVVRKYRTQEAAIAAVCSLFGFFGFSVFPVVMELSVECSYPVGEATSAGLVFVSGQVQSVVYVLVLQALTKPLADSPLSTCGDAAYSWKLPMMVMAALSCFFTCVFVLFFNTRYRRLETEERAACRAAGSSGTARSAAASGSSPNKNI
uniref:Solute carrier family 49 member 3 n=1 Tax=Kryptolebias marmoratus TaxID=37003 RepID=A0A3Q2ZLP3_KRYMA